MSGSGIVDNKDRAKWDPTERAKNFRLLGSPVRNGRSLVNRINNVEEASQFLLSQTPTPSGPGVTQILPPPEPQIVNKLITVRNQGADDILNYGVTDAFGNPKWIALNNQNDGSLNSNLDQVNLSASILDPVDLDVAGTTGIVYVAAPGDQCIKAFQPSGKLYRRYTAPLVTARRISFGGTGAANGQFNSPRGLAVAPSGRIYVADFTNNRIQKFDANGAWISNLAITGPVDVVVDEAGNVYGLRGTQILIWSTADALLATVNIVGTPSSDAACLCVTGPTGLDGIYVFVGNQAQNHIQGFKSTTGAAGLAAMAAPMDNITGFTADDPMGIAISADNGTLYVFADFVAGPGALSTVLLTKTGTAITGFAAGKTFSNYSSTTAEDYLQGSVFGVAVHPFTGNVYVTDKPNAGGMFLKEWTADGEYLQTVSMGAANRLAFRKDNAQLVVSELTTNRVEQWWTWPAKFQPTGVFLDEPNNSLFCIDQADNSLIRHFISTGVMQNRQPMDPLYSYIPTGTNHAALFQGDYVPVLDSLGLGSWSDQSGFKANATQATGANQPIWRMSDLFSVGGFGGADFDGTNDFMTSGVSASSIDCFYVFVVTQFSYAAGARALLGASINGGLSIYVDVAGHVTVDKMNVANIGTSTALVPLNTPAIITVNLTATTWEIGVNGVVNSGTHAQTLTPAATSVIGSYSAGSVPFHGRMHTWAKLNAHLTTAQRQIQEGLYAWKYGVASSVLPGGHPYLSTRPVVADLVDGDGDGGTFYLLDRLNQTFGVHFASATHYSFITANNAGGTLDDPVAFAQRTDGHLFILNHGNSTVVHSAAHPLYTLPDTGFGAYGNADGQFVDPVGIAIDKNGDFWVTDRNRKDIQAFSASPDYDFLGRIAGDDASDLRGIAFHPNVNLGYVADFAQDALMLVRTPDTPVFFYSHTPDPGDTFVFNGQTWENAPGGVLDLGRGVTLFEEFTGGSIFNGSANMGELGFIHSGVNHGASQNGIPAHPGVMRLFTSAIANSYSVGFLSNGNSMAFNSFYEQEWLVMGDTNFENILVGMCDNSSTFANCLICIASPGFNSNRWALQVNNGGVNVLVQDTGMAFTLGVWYQVIFTKSDVSQCIMIINQLTSGVVTNSVAVQTSVAINTALMVPIARSQTAVALTMGVQVDYWRGTFDPAVVRF